MVQSTVDAAHGHRRVKLWAAEQCRRDQLRGLGFREIRALSKNAVAPYKHLPSLCKDKHAFTDTLHIIYWKDMINKSIEWEAMLYSPAMLVLF